MCIKGIIDFYPLLLQNLFHAHTWQYIYIYICIYIYIDIYVYIYIKRERDRDERERERDEKNSRSSKDDVSFVIMCQYNMTVFIPASGHFSYTLIRIRREHFFQKQST